MSWIQPFSAQTAKLPKSVFRFFQIWSKKVQKGPATTIKSNIFVPISVILVQITFGRRKLFKIQLKLFFSLVSKGFCLLGLPYSGVSLFSLYIPKEGCSSFKKIPGY
jgi:hypothetical protein